MRVTLAHPGTQYSHRLAAQLDSRHSLYEFWTGFALAEDAWSTKLIRSLLPRSWEKKIANRVIHGVSADRLRTIPFIEFSALRQLRRGLSPQAVYHQRNEAFQRQIPISAISRASAVIGFDTSSWILAERARTLDKPFFLDQSTAHPIVKDRIWLDVARRFPSWREDLEQRLPAVFESEHQEYQLATRIITASSYTKQTLIHQGIPPEKILVNPYGVDLRKFHPRAARANGAPLRFLFLGAISARKGIPLLLEAWHRLNLENAELWLVGRLSARERALIPTLPGLQLKGKYPFDELPELLRQCDVLAFPSYSDGFALVLLEAMASGMPIITTEATAGPDLIENGKEGFLIPSGDLKALCQAIKFFVENPGEIKPMSLAARTCAERFSWESYGDRWQNILKEFA